MSEPPKTAQRLRDIELIAQQFLMARDRCPIAYQIGIMAAATEAVAQLAFEDDFPLEAIAAWYGVNSRPPLSERAGYPWAAKARWLAVRIRGAAAAKGRADDRARWAAIDARAEDKRRKKSQTASLASIKVHAVRHRRQVAALLGHGT